MITSFLCKWEHNKLGKSVINNNIIIKLQLLFWLHISIWNLFECNLNWKVKNISDLSSAEFAQSPVEQLKDFAFDVDNSDWEEEFKEFSVAMVMTCQP